MSSGNHGARVGFNESGGPNDLPPCASAAAEPRGPGVVFAGLCVVCGRATTRFGDDGLARHAPVRVRAVARCPGCGEELDGGPVLYRCGPCRRSLWAADVSAEYAGAGR